MLNGQKQNSVDICLDLSTLCENPDAMGLQYIEDSAEYSVDIDCNPYISVLQILGEYSLFDA